jgi:hypothetical protein
VVTLVPTINPQNLPVSASFVEGVNCTLTEVDDLIDETAEYNGVIVISNPTGATAPIQGSAWITDPNSPVYYLGPWGQVPYIVKTTTATTQAQCNAMALSILQLIYNAMDTVSFSCVPNSALAEGDVVSVSSPRMGINGNYVISAATVPLDTKTSMAVTCRPQVSPNG